MAKPEKPAKREWRLAVYLEPEDPAEAGNPFIEALPPLWSRADVSKGMTRHLLNFTVARSASVEARRTKLLQIKEYYQPMRRDIDLLNDLVSHLRNGYLNRNPVGVNFVRTLKRGIAALASEDFDPLPIQTAGGIIVEGGSGVGKSSSLQVALDCLPRVVRHEFYKEREMNTHQVLWLKLDCPKSGGVVALCRNFIGSMDRLLGENYVQKYGADREPSDKLQLAMASIAHIHGLGLLVIDEIQNLRLAREGERKITLAFLTNLMNGMGVPIVLVGTQEAHDIIRGAFPVARRTAGGYHPYKRFKNGPAFKFFLEELWSYQLVDEPVPMTDGWCLRFFNYCQGIPDIAVKLFIEVQRQALSRSKPGTPSTITPDLVAAVWKERFKLVHEYLNPAKKDNQPQEPDFGNALDKLTGYLEQSEPEEQASPKPDALLTASGTPPLPDPDARGEPPPTLSKTARAKALGTAATPEQLATAARRPQKSKLAQIVEEGAAKGLKPHEAIRDAGQPPKKATKTRGTRRAG